jgi:hypothetical protein
MVHGAEGQQDRENHTEGAISQSNPECCSGNVDLDIGIRYPNSVKAMVVGGVTHHVSEGYFTSMRAMEARPEWHVHRLESQSVV